MEKGTRIQKVLSEQGIASRRKAEEWIEHGAGAQHQNFLDFRILRHYLSPPMEAMKRSNRYSVSLGPGLASGWNCVVKQLHRRSRCP